MTDSQLVHQGFIHYSNRFICLTSVPVIYTCHNVSRWLGGPRLFLAGGDRLNEFLTVVPPFLMAVLVMFPS